jgi:hypothetical protein
MPTYLLRPPAGSGGVGVGAGKRRGASRQHREPRHSQRARAHSSPTVRLPQTANVERRKMLSQLEFVSPRLLNSQEGAGRGELMWGGGCRCTCSCWGTSWLSWRTRSRFHAALLLPPLLQEKEEVEDHQEEEVVENEG